jgi:membrane glycosyltransferase
LVLILVGFALSLQATLIRPEYFSRTFQLFPNWPVFDAQRMVSLFIFSMIVLLTPKALGLIRSIFTNRVRRGCGGIIGITASVIVELILSALYAPVMMLIQTQHVFDILTGSDSDWVTQRRQAAVLSWKDAWHFHWKHTAVGIVIAVVAYLLSPTLLAWLSPAVAGLMLAIPLSKASGSVTLGTLLSKLAIFRIPEESAPHPIITRRNELVAQASATSEDGLRHLARDPAARVAHLAGNLPRPSDQRGHPNPQRLTAAEKVTQAQSLHEALSWLSGPERIEVAADARMLERLAELPD